MSPAELAEIRARYPAGKHNETALIAMGIRALLDVPALADRVDRLTVRNETLKGLSLDRPAPCKVHHQTPYDFSHCQTHDTTFALGDTCEWDGVESTSQHLMSKVDEQRSRAVRAEISRDQLTDQVLELVAENRKLTRQVRIQKEIARQNFVEWKKVADEEQARADKLEAELAKQARNKHSEE